MLPTLDDMAILSTYWTPKKTHVHTVFRLKLWVSSYYSNWLSRQQVLALSPAGTGLRLTRIIPGTVNLESRATALKLLFQRRETRRTDDVKAFLLGKNPKDIHKRSRRFKKCAKNSGPYQANILCYGTTIY